MPTPLPSCRDWLRGICRYGTSCRFSHPPFDLPAAGKPPEHERVVSLTPGAPIWRPAGAARSRALAAMSGQAAGEQQRLAAGAATLALAEQLGVSVGQLSELFEPEELEASLLLMQEQLQQQQRAGAPPAPPLQPPPPPSCKGGSSSRPSSADSAASGGGMRIVDCTGSWVCSCGERNRFGKRQCVNRQCRKWVCRCASNNRPRVPG